MVHWQEEVFRVAVYRLAERGHTCWAFVERQARREVVGVRMRDQMADYLEKVLCQAHRVVEPGMEASAVRAELFTLKISRESEHVDPRLDECQKDIQLALNLPFASQRTQKVSI